MKSLLMLIGCAVVVVCAGLTSCAPPDNQTQTNNTGTVIDFSGSILYSPTPATAQVQTTLTFSVLNTSTTGTTVTNFPVSVTLTNMSTGTVTQNYIQGVIPSIAPGATVSQNFTVQIDQAGEYTFTFILDPNDVTGFADLSAQTQSTTITFAPAASG
jgi:hypothetical protein